MIGAEITPWLSMDQTNSIANANVTYNPLLVPTPPTKSSPALLDSFHASRHFMASGLEDFSSSKQCYTVWWAWKVGHMTFHSCLALNPMNLIEGRRGFCDRPSSLT